MIAVAARIDVPMACGLQTNHRDGDHNNKLAYWGNGTMSHYQAQWISKDRIRSLRKTGGWKNSILLDSFKGFIIVQPSGEGYGDGEVLSEDAADYELRPEWCTGSKPMLREARKLLALDNGTEEREPSRMPQAWPEVGSSNGSRTRP